MVNKHIILLCICLRGHEATLDCSDSDPENFAVGILPSSRDATFWVRSHSEQDRWNRRPFQPFSCKVFIVTYVRSACIRVKIPMEQTLRDHRFTWM